MGVGGGRRASSLRWRTPPGAGWTPSLSRHNETGEDNAAAHLRSLTIGHEVIVPVTGGKLDLGPWQRVFYGDLDGQRKKRVIIKRLGAERLRGRAEPASLCRACLA